MGVPSRPAMRPMSVEAAFTLKSLERINALDTTAAPTVFFSMGD